MKKSRKYYKKTRWLVFIICAAAILTGVDDVYGQTDYKQMSVGDVPNTKTITRAWGEAAQIIYTEDVQYVPGTEIESSCTAKFTLYDHYSQEYRVADFSTGYWPRVTDFEILDDTVYFCGYANLAASGYSPHYVGYVGYFSVSHLFYGTDVIHVLAFNQQPDDPSSSSFAILTKPCRIEAFKTDKGVHMVCTGGWSHSHSNVADAGTFVADVVHYYPTDQWWYYVHRNDGIEIFSDIAVTDHYVATIAPKENHNYLYFRVFKKPNMIGWSATNPNDDPSIFYPLYRTHPYHTYQFMWQDGHLSADSAYFNYPMLIHTNGDTIAFSYLTYKWNSGNTYGATVKVIAIEDMLHIRMTDSGNTIPYVPYVPYNPDTSGQVTPYIGDTPIVIVGPPESGNNPANPTTSGYVNVFYNRMIDQQRHDVDNQAVLEGCANNWSQKNMVYDPFKHQVLVLHHRSYACGYLDTAFVIDAFYIYDSLASAERLLVTDTAQLSSMSNGLTTGTFCYSGRLSKHDSELIFGCAHIHQSPCVTPQNNVPTYSPRGGMGDIITGPNWSSDFGFDRVAPVAVGVKPAAFIHHIEPVSIHKNQSEDMCN